jgi:hypothetical protein
MENSIEIRDSTKVYTFIFYLNEMEDVRSKVIDSVYNAMRLFNCYRQEVNDRIWKLEQVLYELADKHPESQELIIEALRITK